MPELALLEQKVLTGVIQQYVAPPENVGRKLFKVKSHPFTNAEWDVIRTNRYRSAPTFPNREGRIVGQMGIGKKTATFIYVREKKVFEPTTLYWLRAPGELAKNKAEEHVRRETKDLNDRLERLVESYTWEALKGTITVVYDDGETAPVTVDMGIDATHKPVASPLWGQASDTPIQDIAAWKRLMAKDAGVVPSVVYLSSVTMGKIYELAEVQALLSDKTKDEYLHTGSITGLWGMKWITFDGGYVNSSDTFVPYLADDYILMLATPNNPFTILEGLSADDDAPRNHTGKFAKSWKEKDPSARQVLIEYNFIPVIMRPDQIIYAQIA